MRPDGNVGCVNNGTKKIVFFLIMFLITVQHAATVPPGDLKNVMEDLDANRIVPAVLDGKHKQPLARLVNYVRSY